MNDEKNAPVSYRAIGSRSTRQLALWTGAWVLTAALMQYGYPRFWEGDSFWNLLAMALNLAVGVGMILAIVRFLRAQDEMARKIFLDAAAVTLGVGLVAGPILHIYGGLSFALLQPEIGHLIALMGLTFMISTFWGEWRLR